MELQLPVCSDMQEEAGWQQEAPGEVDRDLSGLSMLVFQHS